MYAEGWTPGMAVKLYPRPRVPKWKGPTGMQKINNFINENPLMIGGMAIVIGIVIWYVWFKSDILGDDEDD